MITVQTLSATVGVAEAEITRWVELTWLRPDCTPGGWLFREVDMARVRLLAELRSLMDQLYAARRRMRLLQRVVDEAAPDAVRARLRVLLEGVGE